VRSSLPSIGPARRAFAALVLLFGTGATSAWAKPPDDPSSDPAVRLTNPDPATRARAATEIGKMEALPPQTLAALRQARRDPEGLVQEAALAALCALVGRHPVLVDELVEAVGDREVSRRRTAASALVRLEPGLLATRVDAILARLDAREADVVAVLAPALLRFEASAPKVLPVLTRCWHATQAPELEPAIIAGGRAALPHLAVLLDDPDPRAHEPVLRLLSRFPVDALVREAARLVPIVLERLPTESPRHGGASMFALLIQLGPEVPESRARGLETATEWLRSLDPSAADAAIGEAHARVTGRVESIRLLLQVILRWSETTPSHPHVAWRPWDRWFVMLLRALPDSSMDAQLILERADETLARTLLDNLAGTPGGEPVLRLALASPDPSRRHLAIQAYRTRDPSPETRLDLLRLLRDPDEALQEDVLSVFFWARMRTPGWRLTPDPLWRSLSDVERVAVLDVLRQRIGGADANRRMVGLLRVGELGSEAQPIGPALAGLVERWDVRAADWHLASYAMTRIGGWVHARSFLLRWLDSPDPWIRAAGVQGLAHGGGGDPLRLVTLTRELLDSDDPDLQGLGVEAAVALGKDAAPLEDWFLERATATDTAVVHSGVTALSRIGLRSDAVFDALVAALRRPDTGLVTSAADALRGFGARAVPALVAVAEQPGSEGALWALGRMSSDVPEARQAIEALVSSSKPEVPAFARSALRGR
jgi:hypothetical protein